MQVNMVEDNDQFWQNRERKFVQMLLMDELFLRLVSKVRKDCQIPMDGCSEKADIKKRVLLGKYVSLITSLYELSLYSWIKTIVNIIVFNKATAPLQPIKLYIGAGLVKMVIRENISLNQLDKFIRDNKNTLVKGLSKLPRPRYSKITDIDIKNKILEDKLSGKEFNEISNSLDSEMYPDYSYEKVSVHIKRMKDQLASLSPKAKDRFRRQVLEEIISGTRELI